MKQNTIKQAKVLGFKVSDRLSYRLDTDTGIDNGELVYFWNVIFPSDYPNQHPHPVYDDGELLALIKQYNTRTEDAKRDTEFSQHNIEAMAKLADMFNQNKSKGV